MRTVLIVLVVAVALLIIAQLTGLLNVTQTRVGEAPRIEGGQLPKFDVDTAKVNVGTKTEDVALPKVKIDTDNTQVKVPTVSVDKAH
jgi:hypothetical protein